ncbi:MAG: hypothetical protein LC689_12985, partial [Myxococcales bacterium]|nr:hypothetical protein [Myxococcales bacterium]
MPSSLQPARTEAPHRRIVVASPLEPDIDEDFERVSWPLTVLRLALQPSTHPWKRGWRLEQRAPLVAVAIGALLLLLLVASGCASVPPLSVAQRTVVPSPPSGMRCESLLVSQELQLPPEGELGEVRLTLRDIPEVTGKLRVLVRKPRFASALDLDTEGPIAFDKVMDVAAGGKLTVVLSRPSRAPDEWPRNACKTCRVDVELTGLFGARQGLDEFFSRAVQEAFAIDGAFARQATGRVEHPSAALRDLGTQLAAEARRCGVQIDPIVTGVESALAQLDGARATFYDGPAPRLPDAGTVVKAWQAAAASIEELPAASAAARATRWPAALGSLRHAALHLDLGLQVSGLSGDDGDLAARWIAVAAAPDADALEQRAAALPPVKDLQDAEARLAWVDPAAGSALPIPGLSPSTLKVAYFASPPHGRKCIGPLGAVPVRDKTAEAAAVAAMLGASKQQLRIARISDIASVRETLRRARSLLCEPLAVDVDALFTGLEERELGAVAERLEVIYAEADPRRENDEIARAVSARTSRVLCRLLSQETIDRRVASVVGYKIFTEGGTRVIDYLPGPLICDGRGVPTREIRRRLREAYRAALDKHAVADRLCPVRGGRCPEDIAASVRRLFGLRAPEIAAPAASDGRSLDFPPPFGFSDAWVQKLDRCGREACEALARLRNDAPAGQFDGALCAPPAPGVDDHPQDVTLDRPDSPSSVTLSGCDTHAGVRLT